MRKYIYNILTLILLISVTLIITSCEDESFNPKTDFVERLILTCIINCESDIQTATLSSSYTVEGFNPYENTTDPSLEGAEIRIWYQDTVFIMRDTIVDRDDTSRYDTPYKYYYTNGLKPERGEELEVEVVLNDGRKLVSSTTTASLTNFFFGDGDQIMPASSGPVPLAEFNVYWTFVGDAVKNLFVPRLFILYDKIENGSLQTYTKEVPVDYIREGEVYKPVFPIGQKTRLAQYLSSAIDRAMMEISEGDPNKQNYIISHAMIQLLVLDENLSAYYGSLQMKSDGFTVKVDAPEYSNVNGGLGIFGSYNEYTWNIEILNDYISSFGYRSAL